MAWARIDDAFDDHPKVLALLENEQGGAAVGLWTLCLTWAHRNTLRKGKTPGLLPASLPRRYLGPGARELASLLVKEGLWEPLAEGDGWLIHDFDRYLPAEKTREARAEAGRKGAQARWGSKAKDGKEPGTDGNLLTVSGKESEPSHDVAGNPIANDGSRAPAHRAIPYGIAPEPEPIQQPSVAAANESRQPTVTQRSKRITDAYADAEPLCKWPAVNGIVIKAIKAGKWSDEEIQGALLRMAGENRPVTVDTLRTELGGLPPARSRAGPPARPVPSHVSPRDEHRLRR